MVTAYQPQFAIAYTVTVMAVLMANCVIFIERVRLKELVIRIFTLLLLCAMLIYGPTIYLFSRQYGRVMRVRKASSRSLPTYWMMSDWES